MATLMGLFQTVANVKNTLDSLGNISRMVSDVADKIEKATPNVKAFNNTFDVLKIGIDSVAEAKKKIEDWKIYEPDPNDFQVWQEWANQLQAYKNELSTVDNETQKIFGNKKIFDSFTKNAFEAVNSLKNLPASNKTLQADLEMLHKMNEIRHNPEMDKIISDWTQFDLATKTINDDFINKLKGMNETISNMKINDAEKLFAVFRATKNQALAVDSITGTNEAREQIEQLEKVFIEKFSNMNATMANLRAGMQEFKGMNNLSVISPEQAQNITDFQDAIKNMAAKVGQDLGNLQPKAENLRLAIARIREMRNMSVDFSQVTNGTDNLNAAIQNVVQGYEKLAGAYANNIRNLTPSVEGIKSAVREYNRLRDSINEARDAAGDANIGIRELQAAREALNDFTASVAESQIQQITLTATIMNTQMMALNAIKGILADIFQQIADMVATFLKPAIDVINGFAESLGITPQQLQKAALLISAIIVLIGLANTQTLGLYLTTSYWVTLWKSNLIVMGITRFIQMISTAIFAVRGLIVSTIAATTAQWGWNVAMWANPIGLIVAAVVILIALIAVLVVAILGLSRLFTWWGNSSAEAADKAAQKTEMLNDVTEKYKNHLKDVVDYYKKQLDYINQVREAAQTAEQKTAQHRQELQNAINAPQNIESEIKKLREYVGMREQMIKNVRDIANKDTLDSFKERLKEAKEKLKELQAMQATLKPLTQVEIEIKRKEIIEMEFRDRDLSKYLPKATEADELLRAYMEIEKMRASEGLLDDITKLTEAQKATKDNLDMIEKNAKAEFLKTFGKLESPIESFNKSIESLNDLSAKVAAFGKGFDADELNAAKKSLFDQLKKGLGIEKFFGNDSNTIDGYRQALETNLKNIDMYKTQAKNHNMDIPQAEFDTATSNAKLAYLKSAYGNLLEKTLTTQETYTATLANLKGDLEKARITQAQYDTATGNANLTYLKNRYGNLLEKTLSAQETYTATLANLNDDLAKSRMTQAQYDTALKNSRNTLVDQLGIRSLITDNSKDAIFKNEMEALKFAFSQAAITQEQYNRGIKAAADKLNGIPIQEDLLKKFMPKDLPIDEFQKLSAELKSIRDIMKPADFKRAKDKLLADLRSGLGIEDYLTDKDSLTYRKAQLADIYKNLILYANETNMTDKQLNTAKLRALKAISEQSEMGQLYQEAISAITPINKKLEDVYNKIDAEARAWKWSAEATDKMKEIARDRIIGESPANEDKPITIAQNKALEKGTLDYYEAQKRGDNQVLKENQKQTKLLTNIANNTKSQPTTTETVQFTVIS